MVDKQNEHDGYVERTAERNDQGHGETHRPVIRWCAPDEAADPYGTIPRGEEQREQDLRRERTERIAALNDLCRTAMGIAGRLVQTAGLSALPPAVQSAIRERVETFTDFSDDNNPWGERDFGNFEYEGHNVYWKIDYYDRNLEGGSEDPSDPRQTTRVLTIMLASEY